MRRRNRNGRYGLALAMMMAAGSLPMTASAVDGPSEADLQAYAGAYLEVEKLRREYVPRAERSSSRSERMEILQQAHDEIRDAIAGHGLTVAEYSEISLALQRDLALREKAVQLVMDYQ